MIDAAAEGQLAFDGWAGPWYPDRQLRLAQAISENSTQSESASEDGFLLKATLGSAAVGPTTFVREVSMAEVWLLPAPEA